MPQTTEDVGGVPVSVSIAPPQDDVPQDQHPSDDGHSNVTHPAQVNDGEVNNGEVGDMHVWYLEGVDDLDKVRAHHKNAFYVLHKQIYQSCNYTSILLEK
jgi:hypothetical protein